MKEEQKIVKQLYTDTMRNPRAYLNPKDFLCIEEEGDYLRVWVTLGGPTIWWTFNKKRKTGRLFVHTQSFCASKSFKGKDYAWLYLHATTYEWEEE